MTHWFFKEWTTLASLQKKYALHLLTHQPNGELGLERHVRFIVSLVKVFDGKHLSVSNVNRRGSLKSLAVLGPQHEGVFVASLGVYKVASNHVHLRKWLSTLVHAEH